MTASTSFLFVTVFLACAVEAVEAFTIVLAAGISRGWRSTIEGSILAVVILALIAGVLGTALITYIPINILRIIVGVLLLIFGLQWLSKAILRSSGFKSLHDETAIYQQQVGQLSRTEELKRGSRDSIAFVVSFKGVFLEGMEVLIIVISFGLPEHQLGIAALAAGAAIVVIGTAGAVIARPLAKVPENLIKLGVGILLTVFGIFWMGEGVGIEWPLSDAFLFILIAIVLSLTFGLITYLKSSNKSLARESRS